MPRISLYLTFGRCLNSWDAAELEQDLRLRQPHVYVSEAPDMVQRHRAWRIAAENGSLARARRDRRSASAHLAQVRARVNGRPDAEYLIGQEEALIAAGKIVVCPIEGYSPEEIRHFNSITAERTDLGKTLQCWRTAGLDEAIAQHGRAVEQFVRDVVIPRNDRMVSGVAALADDLVRIRGEFSKMADVNVLGRLPTAHSEVGYRVGAGATHFPQSSLADEVVDALEDERRPITFEEAVKCFFCDLHAAARPSTSYHTEVREGRRLFAEAGGIAGVLRMLRSIGGDVAGSREATMRMLSFQLAPAHLTRL